MLFAKPRSKKEVVNDIDNNIVRFYRNVQRHAPALLEELDAQLCSRDDFQAFKEQPGITEIQQVARWFVLNMLSFGGNGESFSAFCRIERKMEMIRVLYERLDGVIIENRDYERVLRRYDRPDAFHFIDPPYLNCDPACYSGWELAQMQHLETVIRDLEGRWILTVDDSEENRTVFANYNIQEIQTRNALASLRKKNYVTMRELLISKL